MPILLIYERQCTQYDKKQITTSFKEENFFQDVHVYHGNKQQNNNIETFCKKNNSQNFYWLSRIEESTSGGCSDIYTPSYPLKEPYCSNNSSGPPHYRCFQAASRFEICFCLLKATHQLGGSVHLS